MIPLNKIGLGSVQFGMQYGVSNLTGQTSQNEVLNVLRTAKKYDISIIDTASAYGNAEKVLGDNDLTKFKIVSKFISEKNIQNEFDKSLANLKLNSIYGYLSHRPLSLLNNPTLWEELQFLKSNKKVEKIGFSLNSPQEIDKLLEKGYTPDLVQVPYNYFDNRFKDSLIALKNMGCEIHTRSVFLQGLFFTDVQKLPSFFDDTKEIIKSLQLDLGQDLSKSLLKYVLSLDFIDTVIMGVNDEKQLKDNLKNIDLSRNLPDQDFDFTDQILMPSNWPKMS
ncbi:aldo/keto reductase [Flavobacterium sp.]|uniref:aldo/keto reductase n=1 Tax=Flavobacterium sp. TaxID=239 RepID=UPI0031E064F7